MQVDIADDAEKDLEEIADFIAQDNPARAASFAAELRRKALAIGKSPTAYPPRPHFGEGIRVAIRRPYLIVFRVRRRRVEVLRILHSARDAAGALRSPQSSPRA
jgi:plasmid stabilization system protein ParE